MGLGQLPERAVGEGDHRRLVVLGPSTAGSKPKRSSWSTSASRQDAAPGVGHGVDAGPAPGPTSAASSDGGPGDLGQPDQHAGQQREASAAPDRATGALVGQRVEVLRSADRGADLGRDLQQADLPHALEVGPHGVGVQAERVGDVGRGQRRRRPRPARGRWRSGCCRRAPSADRDGVCRRRHRPLDEITRPRPVKCGRANGAPHTAGRGHRRRSRRSPGSCAA